MSSTRTRSAADADLGRLQEVLGYRFSDPELLRMALTHKSFARRNNERLEFIGDAVLGYLVGVMLYRREDTLAEDALSLMRAKLVRGETLAEVANEVGLSAYLRLGSGERKSGGRQRRSILADSFEAVLGAVHEDGGIEQCRILVQRLFAQRLAELQAEDLKDPKTRLQEALQARALPLPQYEVETVSGADHQRQYTVVCEVPALMLRCRAQATSRRSAEQAAADLALRSPELRALSAGGQPPPEGPST